MAGMALKRDGHDPALAVEIQMIDQPEIPNTASKAQHHNDGETRQATS
jgi:hypothetical protein